MLKDTRGLALPNYMPEEEEPPFMCPHSGAHFDFMTTCRKLQRIFIYRTQREQKEQKELRPNTIIEISEDGEDSKSVSSRSNYTENRLTQRRAL